MKKINIIQFLPYFPPHKGGLETVGEELGKHWVKNNFGKFINITTDFDQEKIFFDQEKIFFEGEKIGYKKDGYKVLVLPSFEIINNFPVYKIWDKKYFLIKKYLKEKIGKNNEDFKIFTHTRFFLTTFIGGIFARKNNLKWIHIEHGSDYVKLNSSLKNFVAKFYDRIIGKWIFKKADKLVGVSNACRKFIQEEFLDRKVDVIYRGLDLPKIENKTYLKEKFPNKIIIGFVGRIFKWKNVESLIKTFYLLDENLKNKIQIVVIGDGEDLNRLKKIDLEGKIFFTGGKNFEEAFELQNQFDIHFHTSSKGGGLATTLLQAMSLGKFIISTPYEGADEVIEDGVNGILLEDDSVEEFEKGILIGLKNFEKDKKNFFEYNKKFFEEKFFWDRNIEKYFEILNEE